MPRKFLYFGMSTSLYFTHLTQGILILLRRWVLANDLLPQAAANIKQNVDWNNLGATSAPVASTSQAVLAEESSTGDVKETSHPAQQAKVRVSQGDCW
jgi:hypothetical protein